MDFSKYKTTNQNALNNTKNEIKEGADNKMRKKPGRKPVAEPVNQLIPVYFTKLEYDKIIKLADGRPLASYLRKIIKENLIDNIK